MEIKARPDRAVLLGVAILALAACGGAGGDGTAPAAGSAAATAAATVKPTLAPRPSGSPAEGYKDDYGY